jgi:hypothetical protein
MAIAEDSCSFSRFAGPRRPKVPVNRLLPYCDFRPAYSGREAGKPICNRRDKRLFEIQTLV